MMKVVWRLVFGNPRKAAKPKKKERNLLVTLLDRLLSLPLKALTKKWNDDLWKQNF